MNKIYYRIDGVYDKLEAFENITSIPPPVLQYFDSVLLSSPIPKFCDDCETLWDVYVYIVRKLKPKVGKNLVWLDKVERLEKQFLGLYERAKAKEIEYEKKTGKSFMQPFDSFREVNRYHPRLFDRIKGRASAYKSSYSRKNNENEKD